MRSSLERILELQEEDLWREGNTPETEDGLLCNQIHMDILTVPASSNMTHTCSVRFFHRGGRVWLLSFLVLGSSLLLSSITVASLTF